MKTLQIAFLAFITTTCIISCKKDNESSKEDNPGATPSSYSFNAIQASLENGHWIIFDQFTKQGNVITAKTKTYFKRQPNSIDNDSAEFILQFDMAKAINKVGNYSVKGDEVNVSFSHETSVPVPTTFAHHTTNGTINVNKVDQVAKTITGTFNWEGELIGAVAIPPATGPVIQKLIGGTFTMAY
jgi:hypothetical protein